MNVKNILALALLSVCVACTDAISEQEETLTEPAVSPVVKVEYILSKGEEQTATKLSEFSSEFFKALCASEKTDKNVVASPSFQCLSTPSILKGIGQFLLKREIQFHAISTAQTQLS